MIVWEMRHVGDDGRGRRWDNPLGCVHVSDVGRRMGRMLARKGQSERSIRRKKSGQEWFG